MAEYWLDRKSEEKHIKDEIKRDKAYLKELEKIYSDALDDVQDAIDRELNLMALSENLSMADAQRTIEETDVKRFSRLAKRFVEKEDFSDLANKYLRRYNVTMRTSRLELLKAYINMNVVDLANKEDKMTTQYLKAGAEAELIRQAGILHESMPSRSYIDKTVKAVVNADYKGAKFSDRVWSNQDDLQVELDKAIRRAIIQGRSPLETSRELRKVAKDAFVGKNVVRKNNENAKYVAERLAVTEMARVQTDMQKISYEKYDVEMVEWIAEPLSNNPCKICEELDGQYFHTKDINVKIFLPQHPFCRCSFAALSKRQIREGS